MCPPLTAVLLVLYAATLVRTITWLCHMCLGQGVLCHVTVHAEGFHWIAQCVKPPWEACSPAEPVRDAAAYLPTMW